MKSVNILLFLFLSLLTAYSQDLYFPPNFSTEWETIDHSELDWCEENVNTFSEFLEDSNTKGCVILKNGRIAYEGYFDDFQMTSSWYWASAGKTVTASMIGILQEEGMLDINDPTSDYLGEGWTNCIAEDEALITVRHQLTMTTGLDFTGGDLNCIEPSCLSCLNAPGEEWFYHNAPYTLLSYVAEAAGEEGYTALTNSKLTNPLGFIGFWTNSNSGRLFWSSPRGMARFGLLMLNNGFWDEEDVIKDKDYLEAMINTSQEINKSYGYLWWLNGKESHRLPGTTITFPGSIIPGAPDDLYAAIGKNGQILMVVPSENLVIVRMGNNPDASLVPTVYVNELWEAYEELKCQTSVVEANKVEVSLKSKLIFNRLEVISNSDVEYVKIYDLKGNMHKSEYSNMMRVGELPRGMYIVEIRVEGRSYIERVIKI